MDTVKSSSDTPIYGLRSNGKAHGDVYTRIEVVSFMLDRVEYTDDRDLSSTVIVDPSCGVGAFLFEIIGRLHKSSRRYGFDFMEAVGRNVRAFDIDGEKLSVCRDYLLTTYPGIDLDRILVCSDFLTVPSFKADAVVGNPPYIRYEQMPEAQRSQYKHMFRSFHYRPDMYVLFYEKGLSLLNRDGTLCLITPNRWLRNEYGKKLRGIVAGIYGLRSYFDMERANPFLEQVLAYPGIAVIDGAHAVDGDTMHYAVVEDVDELAGGSYKVRDVAVPAGHDWSGMFIDDCGDTAALEELGFKIGIGVATGADKIYISKDFPPSVEEELLIPAINSRNLQGDKITWNGERLLNPYASNGALIDLNQYPGARDYLMRNHAALGARHVAKKNADRWYRTIDRISPDLQRQCKLLLPEISANEWLLIDDGNFYPLHSVYYVTGRSKRDLQTLGAVLMSSCIRRQLAGLAVSMNGGYVRWQSQYLRKLRVPVHCFECREDSRALAKAFQEKDIASIDQIVERRPEGVRKSGQLREWASLPLFNTALSS